MSTPNDKRTSETPHELCVATPFGAHVMGTYPSQGTALAAKSIEERKTNAFLFTRSVPTALSPQWEWSQADGLEVI